MAFLGLDPQKYAGVGFGCGLERVAALRFGIRDIREMEAARVPGEMAGSPALARAW